MYLPQIYLECADQLNFGVLEVVGMDKAMDSMIVMALRYLDTHKPHNLVVIWPNVVLCSIYLGCSDKIRCMELSHTELQPSRKSNKATLCLPF